MAMCVYAGTTLIEAQKIAEGDFSAFDWQDNVSLCKVYKALNPAIRDAERAIRGDADKPAVIELLLKSEKMLVKNRVKRLSAIKAARLVSDEELLKRTGYLSDSEKLIGLPEGVVIRASSGVYDVQCETTRYRCSLRGKRESFSTVQQVSVGDRVKIRVIDEKHGIIQAVLRRTNQYERKRTNVGRRTQKSSHTIVANLDGLIIVSSVKEPPIWGRMLDKFLVIAEATGIEPLICFNKIDLIEDRESIQSWVSVYEAIGYQVVMTSATTGEGIEHLFYWMKGKISVVAGLSGVGKSTLLNAIQPGLKLKTQEVNPRKGGRHTTVTTELYRLDFGGFIADTAGIRELNFLDIESRLMHRYFPEMRQLQKDCAKNPCTHRHEQDCAVKAAMKEGRVAKQRYESYCEFRKGTSQ